MIRAVIFDIYKTLLEVLPPPSDAQERWTALCEKYADRTPLSLDGFAEKTELLIQEHHAEAKAAGILHPEIYWPEIARGAWAELASLSKDQLDDFLFEHAQLQRTIRLMPGAAKVLIALSRIQMPLGIASNSQPYTLRELSAALQPHSLSMDLFHRDICFYSFEAGFSKPNPHVFRWLTARLKFLGRLPEETLMVGDRYDNDIVPAKAQGWQTWHLTETPDALTKLGGNWAGLRHFLGC